MIVEDASERLPMRVVIADDEAPARAKLRRLLAAEPDAVIVGEAATGADAVRAVRTCAPDLLFLDVQMPDGDGFSVIEAVGPAAMPDVIFVTAHDEHAIRAFEVHALDFLLKPVVAGRFQAAVNRARGRIADRHVQASTSALAARLQAMLDARAGAGSYLRRILVDGTRAGAFVPVERIDRIEASGNYVRLHIGAASYTLRTPLTTLAARLDPSLFLRANRSTLVRVDAVRAVHPWSHGDYRLEMADGSTVTWSRRYRALADPSLGVP